MDKHIVEFLIRAKKATYAGKGAETDSSRPGSHDLLYAEGALKYIDTYLGNAKFAGEEALWKRRRSVLGDELCRQDNGRRFFRGFPEGSPVADSGGTPFPGATAILQRRLFLHMQCRGRLSLVSWSRGNLPRRR